jgi:hypothetical protein
MAQDYGAAQPIADWVKDHVYTPAQRVLGAIDKIVPDSPQKKEDTSWHDSMVRSASQSYAAKSASKPAPPKYHKGTDYVPKTGPAILKKGEAVLNEKDADEYRSTKGKEMAKSSSSRAHSVLGGSHKKSKSKGKKPHSMHVKRGKSGGFIVTHHHAPDEAGMAPAPDDHVVPDMSALQSHIADNMGDQGPAAPPSPDMSQAGPGAGAPPAAPAAGPGAGAPPAGM